MFTFIDEGVYVFGDYGNPLTSTTIVRVSEEFCNSELTAKGNIFLLTEQYLEIFEIAP